VGGNGGNKVEFSRSTFLKGTVLGGANFSALGSDLTPVYAQQPQSLRDETLLETDVQGRTLNRCEGIAFTDVALPPTNLIKTQAV